MSNDPTTVPATFADMVKLQPKLARLEADCQKASRKLLIRDRDWFWYEYLKPRLNDLVGLEPRYGAHIPAELETIEAHTLAYDHLYAVLHRKKKEWKRATHRKGHVSR